MEREQYARLREQYLRALELPAAERAAFVARAFPGDSTLRAELDSLLAAADRGGSFLREAALGGTLAREALSPARAGETEELPERVGDFRILGLLGRGGMGIVLRAKQSHPQREVALKLMRPGLATADSVRRLRLEAELLGRLQHPGIAQVFAAGTWTGSFGEQPYLALELVRGQPITDHADGRGLGARERLELFAAVCDAVQHAHQKGVIHRDLKPANVLVDGEGQPKILDFGVARLTEPAEAGETFMTQNSVLGTLSYMSPEQAGGQALDTRSDIYSLGCLAYRLLSGRVPVQAESSSSLIEGLRAVQEVEPPLLGELDVRLRGDVETIVAKALEKDPERRYASASDLSADVRRFLEHRPIAARPPTARYLLVKFARRNRALVAGAAAVFVALLLGLVGTGLGLAKARAKEREALSEADEKRAVNDFLLGLFAAPDPEIDGREVRVASLLDRWEQSLEGAFLDRPRVRAGLLDRLGMTWRGLGLLDRAEPPLREALRLREASLPPEDAARLSSMNNLGVLLAARGAFEESERLLREALAIRRQALGPDHPDSLDTWINLAATLQLGRRLEEAVVELAAAFEVHRRVYGAGDEKTLHAENNLGMAYLLGGKTELAAPLLEHAQAGWLALRGADHPLTISARGNLAMLRQAEGQDQEAERLYRENVAAAERVYGPGHPSVLHSLGNLAVLLESNGRLEEAEELARQTLELRRAKLSSSHPATIGSMVNLGKILLELERPDEAEALLREALAEWEALGPPEEEFDSVLATRTFLATILRDRGELEEAERMFREVEAKRSARENVYDTDRFDNLAGLGRTLWLAGRADEAEPCLVRALVGRLGHGYGDQAGLASMRRWLVELRADGTWRERREAELVQRLDELTQDSAGPRELAQVERELGAVLAASGSGREAEELLKSALSRLEQARLERSEGAKAVLAELVLLFHGSARGVEAVRWRERLIAAEAAR